jgi:glycerol-3-phosphate acyltransferase PlsY
MTPGVGLLVVCLGYLCGSIPFGVLLTRLAGLGDLRSIGSGNIGATNVLRTGSPVIAALTLLLDVLKGFVPVLVCGVWWGGLAAVVAGLAAFLGHVFPVWLKFHGGKGVATYIGVLFAWSWPLGAAFIGVWLTVALASRLSSLASLSASAFVALLALAVAGRDVAAASMVLSAGIFLTHHTNLARLMRGEEPAVKFQNRE